MALSGWMTNLGMGGSPAGVVTRRLRRTLHLHASIPIAARDRLRVRIRRVQGEGTVYVIPDMSIMIVRLFPRL